jgi:hypothetical protein
MKAREFIQHDLLKSLVREKRYFLERIEAGESMPQVSSQWIQVQFVLIITLHT